MELAVPQHISKIGVYTGHSFLLGGIIAVYHNFPIIFSVALFTTYSTTITHWYKLRHSGIIKKLDIAAITNLVFTFYFNGLERFCPMCQRAWLSTIVFIFIIYFINSHIFHYQTVDDSGQIMKPGGYYYFSLAYTLPNTKERELSYYYNSYVHCGFLHLLSMTVSIYCTFIMPREDNSLSSENNGWSPNDGWSPENNSCPIYNALYY
jgi:hypothetical protein